MTRLLALVVLVVVMALSSASGADIDRTAVDFTTPVDFTAQADFTAAALVSMAPQRRSTDSQHHMRRLASIPAHSAALIMEGSRGVSPLAGSRALVEEGEGSTPAEAFTAEEASTAAEVTAKSVPLLHTQLMTLEKESCELKIRS